MNSNDITTKACKIFLSKLDSDTKSAKNFLQDADQAFYHDSEIWLSVYQQWSGLALDTFMDKKALYAFMLYQADATTLDDSRFKRPTIKRLYPYNQALESFPLRSSSVYSVKDTNSILNPLTIHSSLKQATEISVLDYCTASYLESRDPYYFTLYYLSLGDIMFKNIISSQPLDDIASSWFNDQLTIAMKVEADLVKLEGEATLYDLHRIMVEKYQTVLVDLIDFESFHEQFSLHYNYRRKPLHYFNSKHYWS